MKQPLKIGTKVLIKAKHSWANGAWGIVKAFVDNYYHVAIFGGTECLIP